MTAGPQGIGVADKVEHHLRGLEVAVRAVIFTLYTLLARHENARIKFFGNDYPWI